jgi:hypothetical protein
MRRSIGRKGRAAIKCAQPTRSRLKLEALYDNNATEYVVTVRHQDGHVRTQRFADAEAFGSWLAG